MSYLTRSTFPPEIWGQILKHIPKSHQPQLLHVSSLFHDIVIKFLFASIKIYFIGGSKGSRMLNTMHLDWMEEIAGKLMCKSWELLNHIVQEPRFANVVKSITVIAFSDGLSIFERLGVASSLKALPNLHTFRWIGNGPSFDDTVAKSLPVNLKALEVQSLFPISSLIHLRSITTLRLPMPFFFPDDEECHDGLVEDDEIMQTCTLIDASTVLENFSSAIHTLRIITLQAPQMPIRVYDSLTELEIFATEACTEELIGLDLVFRHATALQSFSLVGLFSPDVFSFLPTNSSRSLPRLTSFRLSLESFDFDIPIGHECLWALCEFLKDRPLLRRLYIRLPTMIWSQVLPLLRTVSELVGLEVLGLHTGEDQIHEENIEIIAQALSLKLKALHLAINWCGTNLLPLVDGIARLPHLTFLHFYGVSARLPILLEDLAAEGKGLQMIGLNRALWNIDRVGSEIITDKWPRWKIKFSVEEDFLCPDDAWLFKYN
ncbi:hypothetical protein BYT27DRAFT_7167997 [Phlegmacium glaucopus]|nr:hypothetical protein BYT27DRAFT_7167997 [Phlegmacium glaucopus]